MTTTNNMATPYHNLFATKSLIQNAKHPFILTGAGISTAAGIPDFRGKDGLYKQNPDLAELLSLHNFKSNEALRKKLGVGSPVCLAHRFAKVQMGLIPSLKTHCVRLSLSRHALT